MCQLLVRLFRTAAFNAYDLVGFTSQLSILAAAGRRVQTVTSWDPGQQSVDAVSARVPKVMYFDLLIHLLLNTMKSFAENQHRYDSSPSLCRHLLRSSILCCFSSFFALLCDFFYFSMCYPVCFSTSIASLLHSYSDLSTWGCGFYPDEFT